MRLGFTCYLPSAALNALNKDNEGENRNINLQLYTKKYCMQTVYSKRRNIDGKKDVYRKERHIHLVFGVP